MFLTSLNCTARSDYEVHQHLHHCFDTSQRTFLWRWDGHDRVNVLSVIPPISTLPAKKIAVSDIRSGRPLEFAMRLVAARAKKRDGKHSAKVPIISHEERRDWLSSKLAAAGAELRFARFEPVKIDIQYGFSITAAETSGVLVVVDRARFAAHLQIGFGRNRAFGCGLLWLPEVFA